MKVNPEVDYAEAHSPTEWQILGVRLLPLRFGHKQELLREKSPFFHNEREIEPKDLIFALWVCSRPHWKLANGFSVTWRIWALWLSLKMKRNELLFYSRAEMFLRYVSEAHSLPARIRKVSKDGKQPETTLAPSLMVIKRDLMSKHGYSPEQIMEMPMRLAIYERFAQLEDEEVVAWPQSWEAGQ